MATKFLLKRLVRGLSCSVLVTLLFTGCTQKVALLIGGCDQSSSAEESTNMTPSPEQQIETIPQESPALSQVEIGEEEPLQTVVAPSPVSHLVNAMKQIYFAYDSSAIGDDQKTQLITNAQFMKQHPYILVELQGNCDERGTLEYNLTLGERRAVLVKKYLVKLGVQTEQIQTISFGEEKPANLGHDEKSWAENRRVEFVVRK